MIFSLQKYVTVFKWLSYFRELKLRLLFFDKIKSWKRHDFLTKIFRFGCFHKYFVYLSNQNVVIHYNYLMFDFKSTSI